MRSHLKQVKNEEKNMCSSQNTYFKIGINTLNNVNKIYL